MSDSKPLAKIITVLCPIAVALLVPAAWNYKTLKMLRNILNSGKEKKKKENSLNKNALLAKQQAFRIVVFLAFFYVCGVYVIAYVALDLNDQGCNSI